MKMSRGILLIVAADVPPPGTCQTMTASAMTIAMLRRCLPVSGPTIPTIAAATRRAVTMSRPAPLRRPGRSRSRLDRRHDGLGGRSLRRRLRGEPVADAEVRVDVAPARRGPLELLTQLADEDVDRAVTVDHRVAPDPLVDLLALQHLALGLGEQLDELELAARQIDGGAADERLELVPARTARRPARPRHGAGRQPRRARSAPRGGMAW